MPTTTVTPGVNHCLFTTYAPTVTVGDVSIPWTGDVWGACPIDLNDARTAGQCAITGVWYPGRLLKTVNGRRIHVRIPIHPGITEPSPDRIDI